MSFGTVFFLAWALGVTGVLVGLIESIGRSSLKPWALTLGLPLIRVKRSMSPVPQRQRDGRMLSGERVRARLLQDGRCLFSRDPSQPIVAQFALIGEIRWDAQTPNAVITGRLSSGTAMVALSFLGVQLWSVYGTLQSPPGGHAFFSEAIIPLAGLSIVGLVVMVGLRGYRAQFGRMIAEVDSLLQSEQRFS